MPFSPRRSAAFTLIELLIVVAIISILAAIAVPNFLEAQTRAKVSRCKSDLRTLATALESYAVDNTKYPPYGRIDPAGTVQFPAEQNDVNDRMSFLGPGITTPVAYLSTVPSDIFMAVTPGLPLLAQYEYLNLRQHVDNFGSAPPPFAAGLLPAWGLWRMVAAGPDRDRGVDIKYNLVYDPTNGTSSNGDVVRCQTDPESRMNARLP